MKNVLIVLVLIILANTAFAQKRISFRDKKISELNLNIGEMYETEGGRPDFPSVWSDFDPDSENYKFNGYYTITPQSAGEDEQILNGELKLIRYQIQVAEGTLNLKEELTFNFKDGAMNGPVSYYQYSAENQGETDEADLKNTKWKKDIGLVANFSSDDVVYKNINYLETREYDRTKFIVTQGSWHEITLEYFQTIININTADPGSKPVFKKLKY